MFRGVAGRDDLVNDDGGDPPTENLMHGFVQDYIGVAEESKNWDGSVEVTPELVKQIMNCFPPEAVPGLSTIAKSFAISDDWFSSVPSSTWPNRSLVHSGTSRGRVVNKPSTEWALHHDQPTIFERFEKDCAKGTLPAYSFLEPCSFLNPKDMHPPFWLHPHVASSVLAGAQFG
ncbi:MAG: alkaline phosphatase family protein [Polyangiales bacterium]